MQLNRQFLSQIALAGALCAPMAVVNAQTMPGGPAGGMQQMHPMHDAHEMYEMHDMQGMHDMVGMQGVGGMMGGHGMGFLHGLDLDDAQSDQVFMILHEQAPQLRTIGKARLRAERELANLVRSGQYSDAAAKPMVDAIAKSAADAAYINARAQSRIVALLRPDQRARMARAGTRAMMRPAPDGTAPR